MALGYYRRDPLLESLSELGQTLRATSGDVLTRRRLDLQEQAMLGEQEQARDLARLRTLAQQQAGETGLLKTQGELSLQEAQNRRAEEQLGLAKTADVRAGEAHQLSQRTGEFQLQRGEALLPGEVALQQSAAAAQRASAAASGAAARANNIRAQIDQFTLNRTKE